MATFLDSINAELQAFIEAQPLFYVATAPLAADGHINLSPKGLDTFRVLGPNRVAYLDLTGSGNETSAHLTENGRITFMFCAFEGAPNIVRLYGDGRTVLRGTAEWDTLAGSFPDLPGARQLIVADISSVQTSCGYAVPRLAYVEQRDTLVRWAQNRGEDRLVTYRQEKNATSIDGLPTPLAVADGPTGDAASGDGAA